jgi:Amt family ammonium transporter
MTPLSEAATALCFGMILLAPLAIAGMALLNAGLGRSRSAAQSMLGSLCVLAVAAIVYFVFGFAFEGYAGLPQHTVLIAARPWGWLAAMPFFLRGLPLDGSPASLAALLQIFGVALAALIPWGSGSDRWILRAGCLSTALFAGMIYPLFAHWVWGGGWLAQLGSNYGLGRGFADAAGAATLQAAGGLTALAIVWIAGPRYGKFQRGQMPAVFPGHHTVYVLFGCLLSLIGWIGLNGAGSLLFAGIIPGRIVLVALNTVLCASGSLLTALFVTKFRFGKPDASLSANGWLAGLAASSAICANVPPAGALLIGLMLGGAIPFLTELLELKCGIDDPTGSISVHAGGGLWGLFAVGFMGRFGVPAGGQMLAQLAGIATLLGFVLPFAYAFNWLLNRFVPFRAIAESEHAGMDMVELGAGAYPEFMVHTDEFLPR